MVCKAFKFISIILTVALLQQWPLFAYSDTLRPQPADERESGKGTTEGTQRWERQLSDAERAALKKTLDIIPTEITSQSKGFKIRGQKNVSPGAIVAQIPESLADADVSVCGVKGFMIDERRLFTRPDGSGEEIDCADVAALEIIDSPVHVHGVTEEVYVILEGAGKMVLGNETIEVKKGNVILIPPGVEHGLVSNSKNPVKVLLKFTPGIAPKDKPEFRDEKIVYQRTSERIGRIGSIAAAISIVPQVAPALFSVIIAQSSI